ncbi:AKT-interacting protein-like isoform X1 [Dreissena polymorpha]|nr:AKT-interacting protein-like isoform X1 [Dreissena polymorpha]XP_052233581.1 AKT-interacting protein-like isoform X1 [Dreissena polymorpha]XP_052233582.1 AKT-interacting protein-like isoform X1 [Dreissena polymorpha]XP_052233583.1 AKT-interacting protein-like isoform X1 [Dreissena polymorpha]XP_052233584.1 AKT-interacting protein-like isoform X1 [Dreissena polymorpha]XP_052233585.1 AKT-interacting protein-like isoform X1 [Dreissena polymorpha]
MTEVKVNGIQSSEHLPHTSSEVQTADTKTPHIIKDTTTTHPETSQTLCSSDQAKPEASGCSTVGHGLREGRKVLPPIPDPATEAEMTASLHSNTKVLPGGSGEGQIKLEYTLMNEYNMLHKQKLPGIYVIPSALSPLIWNGVLFLRQGLYQDAVFRFNLNIPEAYPNADCPRVFFEFPVFHPAVNPKTGELDVKREFKKWRRGTNFLWQVLMYVRRVFFKIDPKCSWNEEAAELYEHNMEEYRKKVETTVRSSKDVLYNPIESKDSHMIRFSPWEPSIHDEAKTDMLTRKKNRSDLELEPHKRNGLSWVSPGTTQIFSSDESTSSLS